MKYIFDLDTLTYLSDPDSPFFKITSKKASQLTPSDVPCISILTLYELQYSLSNTSDSDIREKIRELINWLNEDFEILPLSSSGAEYYGQLKQGFRQKTGINRTAIKKHNIDLILASTALEYDCILVAMDGIYSNHLVKINSNFKTQNWTVD